MKTSIDITNNLVIVRSNFRSIEKNTVKYGGQTNKGLSGSPVIYRTGKDKIKLKIVGMHLGRRPETEDCMGLLFSDDILNLIYYWMEKI
jgi:V8-like Glu-specific endopeptidase